ncbi:MAG: IS200/IS605 family transposase [Leptospiraceae bacterium]|nr:IS200/IS605 family transposase [Leptospiraceae bacterium]
MKIFQIEKLDQKRIGSHTTFENTFHLVFSTKHRSRILDVKTKIKIRNFIREKERELNLRIFIMNGYLDHLHILVSIPTTLSLSRVLNHFKGYSAFRLQRGVFWQKGYYAKVIQASEIRYVYQYIRNQFHHHTCNQGIITELEAEIFQKNNYQLKKAS